MRNDIVITKRIHQAQADKYILPARARVGVPWIRDEPTRECTSQRRAPRCNRSAIRCNRTSSGEV